MNNASTSAETAEVKTKKPSYEDKILDGIKTTWLALKASDKAWEQNGKKFGKWCSELRKLYKKQGSRKGQGFAAALKKLNVDFQKARYWADVVDDKVKPRYAGGATMKKTTTDPKAEPKLKPFTLSGLNESQQDLMVTAVERKWHNPERFSTLVFKLAVEPGESQAREVVNLCLDKLSLSDQVDFLTELGKWIEGELADLREGVEAGRLLA